jgi:hypothetical protein
MDSEAASVHVRLCAWQILLVSQFVLQVSFNPFLDAKLDAVRVAFVALYFGSNRRAAS